MRENRDTPTRQIYWEIQRRSAENNKPKPRQRNRLDISRAKARRANLIRLGIPEWQAKEWAGTGKGYWRIAGSPILKTSLTNEHLASLGYRDISKMYEIMHPIH